MRWGIIAFIDALGFKGIWKSHAVEDVLTSIEEIKTLAHNLKSNIEEMDGGDLWHNLSIQTRFFSDTLSFAVHLPPPKDIFDQPMELEFYDAIRKYMLLRYTVIAFGKIVSQAALRKVPLLFRGCISAGELEFNESSFIGPAVDEAGTYFEASDGAFVFLTPSAEDVFTKRPGLLQRAQFPYFVRYKVPMKGGKSLRTYTINPLLYLSAEQREGAANRIRGAFGRPENQPEAVRSKAINTDEYLKYLSDWIPPGW